MATESSEPQKSVLIIDDDDTISGAMARALTLAGYAVEQIDDSTKGLARALETHPDLIILDYNMPVMDGLQVLDKLRTDMWGHGAKVLFATNIYDVAVVNEAMRLGVKDYVMKSDLSIDQLVAVVTKHVPASRNTNKAKDDEPTPETLEADDEQKD